MDNGVMTWPAGTLDAAHDELLCSIGDRRLGRPGG